jgi:uncharacterized protein YdaU (DUF1376 family)
VKEKSPAFQWYPKDCDTDENVRAMDDREFGFYVRCLNHSWLNNGLPSDPVEIVRIIGRPKSYIDKVWPRVSKCFRLDGDRLVNNRQEEERQSRADYREDRSKAGKAGNEKRWHDHRTGIAKRSHSDDFAIAKDRSASASALKETPLPPLENETEDLFSRLWNRHPNKREMYSAQRALVLVLDESPDREGTIRKIEAAHTAMCETPDWTKQGGQFAPRLDRWLLNRGYMDPIPEENNSGSISAEEFDRRNLERWKREAAQAGGAA